jgi:hypothetical protein
MVLGTALFDKPPFKNLVCNGLVLAADGKKMSKRLKNYPVSKLAAAAAAAAAVTHRVLKSSVMCTDAGRFSHVLAVPPWHKGGGYLLPHRWHPPPPLCQAPAPIGGCSTVQACSGGGGLRMRVLTRTFHPTGNCQDN